MQQLPLALILIKFPNNSKGICVNIRVKASLNIAYRSGPRIMILGASGVGHPRESRDGLWHGAEAADDREPGEGAQDGHPLGSHKTNDTILDLLVLFFGIFL